MSKHNKVNKSNYDQGGRLTSDEMARERQKQDATVKSPANAEDKVTGRSRDAEASTLRQTGNEE